MSTTWTQEPWISSVTFYFTTILLQHTSPPAESYMTFTSDPKDVQIPVTTDLHMRCGLNDDVSATMTSFPWLWLTTTVSSGLVGKRDETAEGTAENVSANTKRSSSPSFKADLIRHVTSVHITRDGLPVAAISIYTPAALESDLDKANSHVTGDVSQTSGELGYLDIVWRFPTSAQLGKYECTVMAVRESGHGVKVTKSLVVAKSSVDLDDVIRELSDLKRQSEETIARLNATIDQHVAAISRLENQDVAHQSQIDALKAEVMEAKHTETGILDCGSNKVWSPSASDKLHNGYGFYYLHTNMSATFQKEYAKLPIVFLSVTHLSTADFTLYGTQIVSVSTKDFTIRCGGLDTSSHWIEDLEVQWMAVSGGD